MRDKKNQKMRQSIKMIVILFLFFCLSVEIFAKDKKHGSDVQVHKKDGGVIKGELLAVKNEEIILMDSLTLSGITLNTFDIRRINIVKKSGLFKGMGLGLLIGGASGALLGFASGDDKQGFMSFTAGEKAGMAALGLGIVGTLVGGTVGTIGGLDDKVTLEGRTPEEMGRILKKLNARSRFPQAQSQRIQELLPKQKWNKMNKKKEPNRAEPQSRNQRITFSRFHISFKPGYFYSQGVQNAVNQIERIGFGDTRPERDVNFFGISFGSYGPTEFPQITKNSTIQFTDFRLDYSLTRYFALGIGYSPLGKHAVHGYTYIPIYRDKRAYYSELYLKENYSGEMYFLSGSWMPIPDGYLKKVAFKLGASVGISNVQLHYETSKFQYSKSGGESIGFSKKGIVLAGFAELNYFFNRHWSLGVSAEYRYIPIRIETFQMSGYYDDLDENSELIESIIVIDLPQYAMNLGGFYYGINFGFHF